MTVEAIDYNEEFFKYWPAFRKSKEFEKILKELAPEDAINVKITDLETFRAGNAEFQILSRDSMIQLLKEEVLSEQYRKF